MHSILFLLYFRSASEPTGEQPVRSFRVHFIRSRRVIDDILCCSHHIIISIRYTNTGRTEEFIIDNRMNVKVLHRINSRCRIISSLYFDNCICDFLRNSLSKEVFLRDSHLFDRRTQVFRFSTRSLRRILLKR